MTKDKPATGLIVNTMRPAREIKKWSCKHCKEMTYHSIINCFSLEAIKDKQPKWYKEKMGNKGKQVGKTKNDGQQGQTTKVHTKQNQYNIK